MNKEDFSQIEAEEFGKCKSCKWWLNGTLMPSGEFVGNCSWGPPIPMVIPQQTPQGMQMIQGSFRPKTDSNFFCGQHAKRGGPLA